MRKMEKEIPRALEGLLNPDDIWVHVWHADGIYYVFGH